MTPLTKAAKRCDVVTARNLIDRGMDVNEASTGKWTASPLHWPLYACDDEKALEMTKTLVEGGANLDAEDTVGSTPLSLAVSYGKPKTAVYLIDKYRTTERPPAFWADLLFEAVMFTDKGLIRVLVDETKTTNVQNDRGATPLMYAVIYGEPAIVEYLLDLGADPTYRDVYGKSARDYAMIYKNKKAHALLKLAESRPEFALSQPDPLSRIRTIVNRVRDCMVPGGKDYHITISDDDNANAFINISGHITFTREALRQWDDDTLTFVAAHEMAHDIMGHVRKKLAVSGATTTAMIVANIFLPGVGYLNHALNPAVVNNYSKTQEYEADKLASEACEKCFGITKEKQIEIMERIRESSKHGDGGGFWATHPSWSNRIKNIEQ